MVTNKNNPFSRCVIVASEGETTRRNLSRMYLKFLAIDQFIICAMRVNQL